MAQKFQPVHHRHIDVHQHKIGSVQLIEFNPIAPVRRLNKLSNAHLLEQHPDKSPHVGLIVDDQDVPG